MSGNLYWIFNEAMLDDCLAEREATRQREGASEQQAKDETSVVKAFLFQCVRLQGLAWDPTRRVKP